jgi:hypothetical protein
MAILLANLNTEHRTLNTDRPALRVCLLSDFYYPIAGAGEALAAE